jgi:UDP-4-amino-4,6-dideoxy-N-acetyl-beta-L-altrosamine N-acetyltransferase
MYTQHKITYDEHLAWWKKTSTSDSDHYLMYEFDGTPLGIVAFTSLNLIQGSSSWAFYAAPNAPAGTGSRMEYLALEYAFNILKIENLNCEVLSFNAQVVKLHQKFGFSTVKTAKGIHAYDGAVSDVKKMLITAEKWCEMQPLVLKRLEGRRAEK